MNKPDKTLLMIRAYDQAIEFVAELNVCNPILFSPMVCIDPLNTKTKPPKTETVIFTSSNAVRLYADLTSDRGQNICCVGTVTAQATARFGFTVTRSFETAAKLIEYLSQTIEPIGTILYPRAETVSVDIADALSHTGTPISEMILYRQNFQPLSGEAKHTIESVAVITPILSKEIALRFRATLQTINPKQLTIICISEAVASVFDDLNGFKVEIASKPNRSALIQQIKANLST
jgi:uroporphyrinogen-III synthase